MKKKISILSACYNEEENILPLYLRIKEIMGKMPQYEYEHLFADNCSTDRSAEIMEKIAEGDKHVKVILNLKNYGAERSGTNLMLSATGDAIISMASDFQDPPEMIPQFIEAWAAGNKVVWGQRNGTKANHLMEGVRRLYYRIISVLSESDEYERCTGFGIYDKEVIDWIRWMNDPEPFVRNAVTSLGYKPFLIPYEQQKRRAGKSKYNILRYFDTAITSMVNSTRKPLRIVTYLGIISAFLSFIAGIVYFVFKLMYWDSFELGIAPIVIGFFFLTAIQLICLGVVGEYVGVALLNVKKRPLVIPRKLINFDDDKGDTDGENESNTDSR